MNYSGKLMFTAWILFAASGLVHGDVFYTTKEYNNLYNQKVAAELELKTLRQQYQNDKTNLQSRIRDLELEVENLTRNLENCNRKYREDTKAYQQRITELEKMVDLLKAKSSSTEKELISANRELQEKCDKTISGLKDGFDSERQALLDEIEKLKSDYEKKITSLNREITNLNSELSDLKELTDKQKKELSRMENQAQELEKQLTDEITKGEIRLKKYHDRIIINIDDRISFDSGQSELKKNFLPTLEKISKILAQYPEYYIIVEGHTDDVPIKTARFRNNWQLSTERALAVLDYLLKNSDLDPRRFSATGFGEYRPIVSNDTRENRALNRRVDIVVIPIIKKADK